MSFNGHSAGPAEPPREISVDPLSIATARPRTAEREESGLHVCPTCRCDLVYPISWAPADERNWSVRVRCPDCDWVGNGVHSQETVDRFDVELDRGTDMLIEDLARLTRANMEDEIERFISALRADHILAEDF
jgi:hypothetical protein